MLRRIIKIDQDKCTGCSLCASACHEGAIKMIDGKAKLTREDYCDGLGDCLPACPTGAITFEEREAPAYNHAAVMAAKETLTQKKEPLPCGCPGTHAKKLERNNPVDMRREKTESELTQWPVQIKLVPLSAPYFENTNLLVAATVRPSHTAISTKNSSGTTSR